MNEQIDWIILVWFIVADAGRNIPLKNWYIPHDSLIPLLIFIVVTLNVAVIP